MLVASPGDRPGPSRLFYGWIVVAGAFLILFMAYGTQYAFGVFFAALIDEFGWSRASLSGVFSLYAFTYAAFALVSSLAGLLFALAGSIAAWGPLAAGFIYDRAGHYQLAWWLSAGFNALALILLAFARPPTSRSLA
jgi:cyanate permease